MFGYVLVNLSTCMKTNYLIKLFLINFLIFVILIELLSFIFIIQLNITSRPNFINQSRHHYGDYNKDFGAWHLPNKSLVHKKSCFEVIYNTNSYGAVDIERDLIGKNRSVVIGDSIVEGYGIEQNNRFSNILENKLNIPHLNFGTSGHFGTTQYNLLYSNLASKFKHSKVLIFITAANDFEDDSYPFGKIIHKDRYRPYFIKEGDNYKLIYTNRLKNSSFTEKMKNYSSNFTHTYHLLRYLKSRITTKQIQSASKEVKKEIKEVTTIKENIQRYSFYNVFNQDGLDLIKFNLLSIKKKAEENNAKLYVILLPTKPDLDIYFENKKKIPKLTTELKNFSKENNIKFIDILTSLSIRKEETEKLFFTCDGHPNEFANKLIANILLSEVYEKN